MRLARAIRRCFVVAVESQTVDRTAIQPPIGPEAQAGARWGQPAVFDQASRPRASDEPVGFTVDWVDTYRVFKGSETHREYSRVAAGETEPEGIRSVTFYSGSRKERRNVRGVIFTNVIHDYVKFNFPVLAFSGARGEPHPPPTPENEVDE